MGASLVAVYAVGASRSGRAAAAMLGAVAVLLTVVYRFAVDDTRIWVELTVIVVSAHLVAAAVGVTVRSRRDLVGSLRERARQAEEGQRLRVEEAKHAERVARQGAYDALEDLRSVLGMLRDGTEGERPRLGSTTCPGS